MKFVELHIIQSFAPSCLNRDEANQVKRALVGNAYRARISSQCLNYAQRNYLKELGAPLSTRSRGIPTKIREMLVERGRLERPSEVAITAAFRLIDKSIMIKEEKNGLNFAHSFFLSNPEIDRLVAAVDKHFDILSKIEIPESEDPTSREADNKDVEVEAGDEEEKPKKKGGKKAKVKIAVPPEVKGDIRDAVKMDGSSDEAIDNWLNGRMVAEEKAMNIVAASQTAHAVSTHALADEHDDFTLGDDLGYCPTDMMDNTSFTSPTMYRYSNVDFSMLPDGLSPGERRQWFRWVLESRICSVPGAKQKSFAAPNLPSFIMAVVRPGGVPMSLWNAFHVPVDGRDQINGSIARMSGYWSKMKRMYARQLAMKGAYGLAEDENLKVEGVAMVRDLDELIAKLEADCFEDKEGK